MADFDLSEYYDDGERTTLVVNITDEGVIMDVFVENACVGTIGMMAGEWADFILNRE